MNWKLVLKVVGRVLLVEAVALVVPMLVALLYGESPMPFLLSIALVAAAGWALSALPTGPQFFTREGFCAVALIWLATGLVGGLPFLFCGQFATPIDCFFESCSGFTTTGATILTDIEALPQGILFWRAFTHWMGGMGVLVLATAVIPSLGIRSRYLAQAETPGPVFSKLVPKQSQTSKILYGMYLALTVAEIVCLKLAGMPLYDCFIHAFSTAGTGGFSNRAASVGAYSSAPIDFIIAIFILLFSINFALYFLLLTRRFREVLASDELRFFLLVVALATLAITVDIRPLYSSMAESFRYALFQVSSIISTTGFATADFALWPQFSQMILILLMFCGACAGSTGGGMKCCRVLLLLRSIRREIRRIIHPQAVEVVKLDGKVVEEDTLHSLLVFMGAYLMAILVAGLVISLDGYSFAVSFSSALTCVSNVGPGLEIVGPSGNFAAFSGLSKLVMSLCMIVGRLEIFPILVLFSPSAWSKL
ncbi:MAG: TrkH family potassium uptake protein [Lawsonibacter sp.]|nr:TrkH family potassium uptake protein [Lawsonibacter sp.]